MIALQKNILLPSFKRGFHIITNEIIKNLPELKNVNTGILNIFIQHTSASLTINENVSPDVREDFETYINKFVPENNNFYTHNYEGSDDMPAHIKASLFGPSLIIPITNGKLNLGTWQGIYLCEHRNNGGRRKIFCTLLGE